MVKQKKYGIIGGVLALAVIAGAAGTFAFTQRKHVDPQLSVLSDDGANSSSTPISNSGGSSQSVPLNQARKSTGTANTNNLNVSTDTAASRLGQITPTQPGETNRNSSGPAASNNTSSAFDPATFKDYEKYKDGTGALFGDAQKGDGAELTDGKKAAVYYKGWLTNGTLFDQSRAGSDGKLQPFVFTMGAHQVIPGWEQALAGMKVGGVRLVIVPPSVGYGASGQGSIPPNAVLVFQVQLAAVQ